MEKQLNEYDYWMSALYTRLKGKYYYMNKRKKNTDCVGRG